MNNEHCPKCDGPTTTKGITVDGNSVAAKLEYDYCLNCGWDSRSGKPESEA